MGSLLSPSQECHPFIPFSLAHDLVVSAITLLRAYYLREKTSPTKLIEVPLEKIPPGIVIQSGTGYPCEVPLKNITNDQWKEINSSGSVKLYCCGLLEYEDVFKRPHETGFCWEYQNRISESGFYISNNKKLNYYT
jgi:hypothetical protein